MAQKNFIKRIISSPLVQTFLIYLSGGWIALEMTDYFIKKYDLNEKISDILPIIMLIGLPVAIFFAWYLSREKEELEVKVLDKANDKRKHGIFIALKGKPWFSIPGSVVLILLVVSGIKYIHMQTRIKWATEKAIPEIEIFIYDREYVAAFKLFQRTEKYIQDKIEIENLTRRITRQITIITDPPGAEIYIREYKDPDGDWELIGSSPIDSTKMPDRTFYLCKIEKETYEPLTAVLSTRQDTLYRKLFKKGKIPPGMVHVDGFMDETAENYHSEKHSFFMDKFEVTNEEFKKFVDNQGYNYPGYWRHEFFLEGRKLSWEEAIILFKDNTGRPGPSTWEASDYPEGREDYPVNGISWYEAAAYAEFVGKELPTLWHWYSAMGKYIDHINRSFPPFLFPLSNMNYEGTVPVGYSGGVSCYGNYDMAGNTREWCWNKTQNGRVLIGGAWNDVSYMYNSPSQAQPFDRSPKNGFRCVTYIDKEKISESAFKQVSPGSKRDFYKEEPVSDEVFKVYRNQFLYDKTDLQSIVEERDEGSNDWIKEKITFEAAYGNERMIAYLFLPKQGSQPYQTLVYFPGDYALRYDSLPDWHVSVYCDFLLNNNIAVMWPIYEGTYDRYLGLGDSLDNPKEKHIYTEYLTKWVKDFSRSIDYLETRTDIDSEKIGYYGHSWGGMLGAIIPAIEERLKLSVLVVPGLYSYDKALPEADVINYVTRVKIPVLMLNGRYDYTFVLEKDVDPMYNLFGTPEQDKVLKLYDTDHYVPKTEIIKETLNWLDKYFGPAH